MYTDCVDYVVYVASNYFEAFWFFETMRYFCSFDLNVCVTSKELLVLDLNPPLPTLSPNARHTNDSKMKRLRLMGEVLAPPPPPAVRMTTEFAWWDNSPSVK